MHNRNRHQATKNGLLTRQDLRFESRDGCERRARNVIWNSIQINRRTCRSKVPVCSRGESQQSTKKSDEGKNETHTLGRGGD